MRYTYSISNNKVVCISHFAGKAVRGISKCDSNYDDFDVEVGKKLAQARCDLKIAEKRFKRASSCLNTAIENLEVATEQENKMRVYYADAHSALVASRVALKELEETLV